MDPLYVHYQGTCVGRIIPHESGLMSFTYEPEWLSSPASFPISISLPLDGNYPATAGHRFFANLLPEADVRSQIGAALKISPENDFLLLKAVGGDCAGALSIETERIAQLAHQPPSYEPISHETLIQFARARQGVFSTVLRKWPVRLSLAGAQDKLPVHVVENEISIPTAGTPSTHILKFPSPYFSNLPENESFITMLAEAVQLQVVRIRLLQAGKNRISIIERYDRMIREDGVRRLQQEDFCQALGIDAKNKYEKEGGPSLKSCAESLRRYASFPIVELQKLLNWTLFNWLIGNADAHGKNLSLIYDEGGGIRLAPFYDLVCTRNYRRLSVELAMAMGGGFHPDFIRKSNLQALAIDLGIQSRTVMESLGRYFDLIPSSLDAVVEEWRSRFGESSVLDRLPIIIRKQIRRAKSQL